MDRDDAGDDDLRRWGARSVEQRAKLSIGKHDMPWTDFPDVKLAGVGKSARQRDVVDVCFAALRAKNPTASRSQLVKGQWANIGQSIERLPLSSKPQTLTTRTVLYSYEKNVVLSGAAHLRLLGWGQGMAPLEVVSEVEARSLAADSFSVPISAQMSFAYYINPYAPWWQA